MQSHEHFSPENEEACCELVRRAADARTPLFPLGGDTESRFGNPARSSGWCISTSKLKGVVDYPARDLTITVRAGATLAELDAVLREEGQCWPIDVALPEQATIGGAIAAAAGGPRRLARGLARDYVIGISAIDGLGRLFHGGGRVVKNVAGYDFCKLLTGSRGALGLITAVTLKLVPRDRASAWVHWDAADLSDIGQYLQWIAASSVRPSAVQIVSQNTHLFANQPGAWRLSTLFEGPEIEVAWSVQELTATWRRSATAVSSTQTDSAEIVESATTSTAQLRQMTDWPLLAQAPFVLKLNVSPSQTIPLIQVLREEDPNAQIVASGLSGLIWCAIQSESSDFVVKSLIGRIQPAAQANGGRVTVVSGRLCGELSPRARFGDPPAGVNWMLKTKRALDPNGIWTPDRFPWSAIA